MKRVREKYEGKVDLTTWNLDAVEELFGSNLRKAFLKAVSEAVSTAIDEANYVSFSHRGKDPMRMVLCLPLGSGMSDPFWEFSLRDVVELEIQNLDDGVERAAAIRDGLRKLADKLDAAIQKGA